jgi:hypothetical protein
MNGATAELDARASKTAASSVTTRIGASQYFFLTRKNRINSRKNENTNNLAT